MRDIIRVLHESAQRRIAEYDAMSPEEQKKEAHRSLLSAGIIQPNGEYAEHLQDNPMTHHVNSPHFAGSLFKGEGVYETLPQRSSASHVWQNRSPHPDLIRELIIACAMSKESDRTVGRALMALAGILLEDGDAP